jgi:hypothetical protein
VPSKTTRTEAQQKEYDQGYRDGAQFYIDSKEVPEHPEGVHPSAMLVQPISDPDDLLEGKSIHYRDGFEAGVAETQELDD